MFILEAVIACIFGESHQVKNEQNCKRDDANIAADIVELLYTTEKNGRELKGKLHKLGHEYSWTESLAKAVLDALDATVREGRAMSPVLKDAFDKASEAANAVGGFIKDHPIFCTVIVLGILVLLMPWVIEVLGFTAQGPVEGSFAAWWQSTYVGYVPKGSLFSFFQRLGMTWHY